MSTTIVPQELQEKIVKLYVEKQMGMAAIKKALNVPFGPHVIKRVLIENGVRIRTLSEALKGKNKLTVPKELIDQIIGLYNRGYGLDRIVEELKLTFSFDKVRSLLQENNVHIRTVKESAQVKIMPDLRKFPVNDNYPLDSSHNGAWLMGFIAADGYLPKTKGAKNRIVISLQEKDEEVLQAIAKEIGFEGPIHHYLSVEGFPFVSLAFSSNKLRQTLEKHGIVNAKTYKLNSLPKIEEKYLLDFIRGFFDGDGSVFGDKTGLRIKSNFTSASKNILEEISQFLHEKYNLTKRNLNVYKRDNIIYELSYGTHDTIKLCELFYDNLDNLSLLRKKAKFYELLDKRITRLR